MELLKLQQTWFTSQSLEPLPGNPIYRNLQIDKRAKKLILNYVCSNTSDFVVFGCAGLCSLRPSPQCGSYILQYYIVVVVLEYRQCAERNI